jgi:hypothetical protein
MLLRRLSRLDKGCGCGGGDADTRRSSAIGDVCAMFSTSVVCWKEESNFGLLSMSKAILRAQSSTQNLGTSEH